MKDAVVVFVAGEVFFINNMFFYYFNFEYENE